MAYPSRPLRKTSFSQQEAQGNDLSTATLDAELNQLVACFDQLASRLESITTPAGLLKSVAAATAMALNGVQVFTATASQTVFTTTIAWDASFSNLTVTVVSQGLKLDPSLVTVANSGGFLRVTIPAQTVGSVVQVLAYSAGAGVLTRLASLSAGDGATLVAVRDVGGYWTSAEVEGALQEVGARVVALEAGDPTRWKKDGSNGPATGNWNLGTHQIKGLAPGTLSTDAVNLEQLSTLTSEVSSLLRGACTVFGFRMQGGIDMDGNAIENVPAPSADGDAANKKYVVDNVAAAVALLPAYLKRDGTNAMTANLDVGGNKLVGVDAGTTSTDAPNLGQLAGVESGTIARNGSRPPSADISWNNKKLTDLAAATNPGDAVRFDQIPSVADVLRTNGSNSPTADMPWGGKKITGLANGVDPQDAVTVAQLPSALSASYGSMLAYLDSAVIMGDSYNLTVSGTTGTQQRSKGVVVSSAGRYKISVSVKPNTSLFVLAAGTMSIHRIRDGIDTDISAHVGVPAMRVQSSVLKIGDTQGGGESSYGFGAAKDVHDLGAAGDEYYVALTGDISCIICISITPF